MPYLYTHALHGLSAREKFPQSARDVTAAHRDAFLLGLYGPDVYFGDRLPPPLFDKPRKSIGNALHGVDGAALFRKLFALTFRDDRAYAYALGFLCHFVLDSGMHPYIESQYRGNDHTRFEMRQDLLMRARSGRAELMLSPNALYDTDRAARMADTLMTSLVSELLSRNTAGVYERSYHKWQRVQRLAYDPSGKKLRFLKKAERALGKPDGKFSGFLLTIDPAEARDLFNQAHAAWRTPWEADVVRTESYFELFDRCVNEAAEIVESADAGRPYGAFDAALSKLAQRSMDGKPANPD